MQISRSQSRLYRFNATVYPNLNGKTQISRCAIFWMTIFAIMIWAVVGIFAFLGFTLGWLFAKRGPLTKRELNDDLIVNYHHWPTWGTRRILPILLIIPTALILTLAFLIWSGREVLYNAVVNNTTMIILSVGLMVTLIVWTFSKLRNTTTWHIFVGHIKDFKNQLCPLIEIVD